MRIEVVVGSRELFGSDRSAIRLCSALRYLQHDVTLVLPSNRPERGILQLAEAQRLRIDEAPVAVVSSRGVESLRSARSRGGQRPDITILNTSSVLGTARPTGRRITIIREWLDASNFRHRLLANWHATRSAMVVAVSNGVLEQWRKSAVRSLPSTVIWNWLEDDWLKPYAGPPSDVTGIVCLGRFNDWKGQGLLARSYLAAFVDSSDPPPLSFIGSQPGTEFASNAQILEDRRFSAYPVQVRPALPDTRGVLESAQLLVLPSLKPEPFGTVILEALASGCKVLATHGGGPDDLAPLFRSSLTLVTPDTDSLAQALRRWFQDDASGQTPDDRRSVLSTIRDTFASGSGAERWRSVLDRFERHSAERTRS